MKTEIVESNRGLIQCECVSWMKQNPNSGIPKQVDACWAGPVICPYDNLWTVSPDDMGTLVEAKHWVRYLA